MLAVVRDRVVLLIAAHPDRFRDDDAAERDHGHLARPPAHVEDHASGRLAHGQARADRRGHRLLDQIGLPGPRRETGLLDRSLLDPGDARGDADHHPGVREAILVDPLDEVAQHLLGHVEVGDHTILERSDGSNGSGGATQHPLRLDDHGVHLSRA